MAEPPYTIEFYAEETGDEPALRWIKEELTLSQRQSIGVAMQEILQNFGADVCKSEYGKALGEGLYESRLRRTFEDILGPKRGLRRLQRERILLRVFFHPHGDKLILLLGGYDKGRFPSRKRQEQEISVARARLADWRRRQPGAE